MYLLNINWSNEEQKQNIKKQLYENEKAYQRALFKKYSTENLFDNNKNIVTNITTKEEQLTVYKESTLKKTIRKILEFFKR